jgi:hypothetical protein
MKKIYTFLALAALAFVSCSKQELKKLECACEDACGCKETNPHDSKGCTSACDPWHKK